MTVDKHESLQAEPAKAVTSNFLLQPLTHIAGIRCMCFKSGYSWKYTCSLEKVFCVWDAKSCPASSSERRKIFS